MLCVCVWGGERDINFLVFFPKELTHSIGRITISMNMPMFKPRALNKYLNTSIGFKLIKKIRGQIFLFKSLQWRSEDKSRMCVGNQRTVTLESSREVGDDPWGDCNLSTGRCPSLLQDNTLILQTGKVRPREVLWLIQGQKFSIKVETGTQTPRLSAECFFC